MATEEYQLLLVADKDSSQRFRKAVGRGNGLELEVAHGLDEALKLLGTRPVDVILLDVALPEAPGIRGCLALRQAQRSIPIVCVARRRNESDAWDALRAGAQDFLLVEDLDAGQLTRAVRYAVERQRAASRLASEESLMQSILQNLSEGVVVADRHEKLLLVNPSARRLLGIGSLAGLPTDLFGLYRADTGDPLSDQDRPMARAVRGETVTDLEIFHRNAASPQGIYLSVNARPMRDADGVIDGGIVSFRDISDRKRAEEELAHLALYDRLTGVPNRSFFIETLGKAISRSRRSGKPLAVLLLDVDRFKRINDELGHELGDQLLQEVGRRLTSGLRAGDFVARLGGDEFAILFEDYGHSERAAGLAEKVREILEPALPLGERELKITVSVGIASFPDCADDAVSLLKTADIALYRAKESGRDNYHFYSRAVHAEVSRRAELEHDLRKALSQDQFELVWQPVVDVEQQRAIAVEALIRWQHPGHGLIRPVEFIPILETSGLIHQVGERVLAEACSQLADWRRQLGLTELSVAVNLSVHQLEHPRLAERIDRILTSAGLPPSALVLEFRGDALGPAHPGSSEVLAALANGGVRLALDDFGVGWLSLQRLRGVKLEWLKLEREFVQGLPVDVEDCLVADAALALAGLLRAELVAEAVESPAQLDYLVQRGCRLAQGFLFSPPVSAAELPALLTRSYGSRHLASTGA